MSAKSLQALLESTLEEIKGNAATVRAEADATPHEWTVSRSSIKAEIYKQLQDKNYLVQGRITAEMRDIVTEGVRELVEEAWKKAKELERLNEAFVVGRKDGIFSIVILVGQQLVIRGRRDNTIKFQKDLTIFDSVKEVYKGPLKQLRANLNTYFKKEVDLKNNLIRTRNLKAKKDRDGNIIRAGKKADTLLQLGHEESDSIADIRIEKAEARISEGSLKAGIENNDIREVTDYLKNRGFDISFEKSATKDRTVIKVFLQSQFTNQGRQASEERARVTEFRTRLEEAIKGLKTDFLGSEGSDSKVDIEKKKVLKKVSEGLSKNKRVKLTLESTKLDLKSSKAKKRTKAGKTSRKRVADSRPALGLAAANSRKSRAARPSKPPQQNYFSLIPLINRALPDVVRRNMQEPGLVNRSGRFAQSARVTDIITTRKGYPSIGYTYEKNPYQVFELGKGKTPWATDERDPRRVIDKSIREIATGLIEERFYTRRV